MINGATNHSPTDPPWTLQTLFMRVINDMHAEGSHKAARAARASWQLEANLRHGRDATILMDRKDRNFAIVSRHSQKHASIMIPPSWLYRAEPIIKRAGLTCLHVRDIIRSVKKNH
jgi:hypothetical protein